MKSTLAFVLAGLLATALAHGGVIGYQIDNPPAYVTGFMPYSPAAGQSTAQREWDTDNPVYDPTQPTIVCNANGAAGSQTAVIAAGSNITAYWTNPWLHSIGPLVTWMAAVNTSQDTPAGAAWFKLDQAGLMSGPLASGIWGMGEMLNDNSSWTSTIPSSLKAGLYLLRNEVIALHQPGHPQFYMECLQLQVTGNGTASPPTASLAAIPGVYQLSDPSLSIDVFAQPSVTTYSIPGPRPWTGQ